MSPVDFDRGYLYIYIYMQYIGILVNIVNVYVVFMINAGLVSVGPSSLQIQLSLT